MNSVSSKVLDLTTEQGIKTAFELIKDVPEDIVTIVTGAYLGTTASAMALIGTFQALGWVGWGGLGLISSAAPWAAPWLVPVLSTLGGSAGGIGVYLPIFFFNPLGITILVGIAAAAGVGANAAKNHIKKLGIRASQLKLVEKFLDVNGKFLVPIIQIKAFKDEKLLDQILDVIHQNKLYKLAKDSSLEIGGRSAMHLFLNLA